MLKIFQRLLVLLFINLITVSKILGIIAPIRISPDNNVILLNSDEIKLTYEQIELYHHPLGIWLVEYEAILKNIRNMPIKQPVSFPSGFEMRMIEKDLYSEQFENFQVLVNNKTVHSIKYLVKCVNYVETTGTKWDLDDGSGMGFLNTWELNFEPEETKTVKITFCFNVNKPPVNFDPNNKKSWYTDSMEWIKSEYSMREQHDFKLPLNLGSFWALYPDSIVIRTHFSNDWLRVTEPSKRTYQKEHITRYEFSEPYGFYSPPKVAAKSLTIAELQKMTRVELKILKNSFPAKYGKIFKSNNLNLFFSYQPWYFKNPDFHAWLLTESDIENIKLVLKFEKSLP